ncbi:hypothetical protein NL676_010619 [Syzygium grande]|nr:hypothetical protein NL676_010619 [Syzygium grande]
MDEIGMREVLEGGVTTCAEAEVDIIEGGQKDPRMLEEELQKVTDQLDKVMKEKLQLESQFSGTDQSRRELELKNTANDPMLQTFSQEREPLQIDFKNPLEKAEEVSRRKGDSSGTKYFSGFSMTGIREAVQNLIRPVLED